MAVLIASNLRKELSGDPLFDEVSFSVDRGQRLALAGQNGAGKTTLLRAIIGETTLQGGELALQKGARVALHDQRPPRDRGLTLREYSSRAPPISCASSRSSRTWSARWRAAPTTRRRFAATARLETRLEHAGAGAGVTAPPPSSAVSASATPISTGSSPRSPAGELTRASLARALAGDPDLLLLDEPTNHLDVESLEWLERELTTIDAAVVLVAHDRWFLESVTTAVLELEGGRALTFSGPWHQWRIERAARAQAAAKSIQRCRQRHRASRAVCGAVPLQEVEGQAGSGEDHPDRPPRAGAPQGRRRARESDAAAAHARLRVPEAARTERPSSTSKGSV